MSKVISLEYVIRVQESRGSGKEIPQGATRGSLGQATAQAECGSVISKAVCRVDNTVMAAQVCKYCDFYVARNRRKGTCCTDAAMADCIVGVSGIQEDLEAVLLGQDIPEGNDFTKNSDLEIGSTTPGRNPTPPPPKKAKPSYYTELINPDGSSDTFETGGFMPRLRQPQPNSGDLVVQPAPADPNSGGMEPVSPPSPEDIFSPSPTPPLGRCVNCDFPITAVATGGGLRIPGVADSVGGSANSYRVPDGRYWEIATQTDPLVFPYENQLVVLPPFVYPHGTKWWL